MDRTRIKIAFAVVLLPLALAACGGVDRNALYEELETRLAGIGASDTQMTCIIDFTKSMSDDELKDLNQDTPSEAVQAKMTTAITDCMLAP